jgi:hypothetical protein
VNSVSACLLHTGCFPHVINLAVQAIYAALKDRKGLEEQYLLGNIKSLDETIIKDMDFT